MRKIRDIQEVTPNFRWDSKKIWKLDLPVIEIDIQKLLWHFAYPFWDKIGTDDWNLTPEKFISNPTKEPLHQKKVDMADLSFPLEIIEYNGRYRILDGLHRLVKAYLEGRKTMRVRIVPPEISESIKY